jgi:hypothetical protein
MTKTVDEVLEVLSDTIRKVRSGELSPAEANAITREMKAEIRVIELAMRSVRVLRRLSIDPTSPDNPQLSDPR